MRTRTALAATVVVVLGLLVGLECERRKCGPPGPPAPVEPFDPADPFEPWQPSLYPGACDAELQRAAIGCAWPSNTQLPLFGDRECSKSPDLAPACCAQHDIDYALGGTEQDRLVADLEMAWCFALYGVDERVVWTYYKTLRKLGGSSWTYTESRTRGPPDRPGPGVWGDTP
jgi:hypothetical protein